MFKTNNVIVTEVALASHMLGQSKTITELGGTQGTCMWPCCHPCCLPAGPLLNDHGSMLLLLPWDLFYRLVAIVISILSHLQILS